MNTTRITCFLIVLVASAVVVAQVPPLPTDENYRTGPVEPFRIVDNIYYVGPTLHNTSYLITGSDGHVLIDTIYERSVPAIVENIRKLGFKPEDIRLIIGTHAHSDHVAGHARMKELTGARILASVEDKEIIENGGKTDFRGGAGWTPAKVDQIIKDGEEIRLGDILLTAHFTPGHTKGCMTFTMIAEEDMQKFDVLFLGGVRMSAEPILGHPLYPNMAEDLAMTFAKLEVLPVDIYLGGHGYWNELGEKIERMNQGEGYKAFIDPEGYRKAINGWQKEFIDKLVQEGKALLK